MGGPSAPYSQSERGAWYDALFARLEADRQAYACFCTAEELELSRKLQRMAGKPPRYAGTCRFLAASERAERMARGSKPTLRFAVPPDQTIEFVDLVHGPQKFASNDIGDFIIRREDGTSAFFFCNAVDDAAMGVTHVLRGDDHLTNTPRQLMLLDALGLRRPDYGHVGLLVGSDGAPLSKRHGSTSVQEFRERGFLPAALLNHLFHLGHTGDVEGWLPPSDMPAHFRPEHLGRAPARFEEAQLLHWQKETLQRMSAAEVGAWLGPGRTGGLRGVRAAQRGAARGRGAVDRGGAGGAAAAGRRGRPASSPPPGPEFFAAAAVQALDESSADFGALVKILKERTGRKGAELFMPLRVALTGQTHGPELAPLLKIMPRETARRRLQIHARNP